VLDHKSSPNYFYFKDKNTRFNRVSFQKHKLENKLNEFDPALTE
jgi:chaperonin cofactor prefoldin